MTGVDRLLAPGALSTRFHPIVATSEESVFAFECLTRGPAGTNYERADVLFEYARLKGIEPMLDRACIARALASAVHLAPCDLSFNVHPSTLASDARFAADLEAAASAYGFAPERIIIEIVEQVPVLNRIDFLRVLDRLRDAGFRIAIDDVGHGHSNFALMLDVRPHLLKIDRHFIDGAHCDAVRGSVIDCIAAFAQRAGARVVAEGVENEADRDWLAARGIDLMQGFLFATPMTADQAALFSITNQEQPCPPRKRSSSSTTHRPSC